jgi:hypothetical protein
MRRKIQVGGVEITDRERPAVCDYCEGVFDGTEREVWIAGVRVWVHRKCETRYLKFLNANPKHQIGALADDDELTMSPRLVLKPIALVATSAGKGPVGQ